MTVYFFSFIWGDFSGNRNGGENEERIKNHEMMFRNLAAAGLGIFLMYFRGI